jgi:hypothetical protein
MKRKTWLLLLLLALLCLTSILVYMATYSATQASVQEEEPQGNSNLGPPEEGANFVVPENPLGILGLMSALAVAFGIFNFKKKRQ